MSIHPIETRYGTPEMRSIWTEEARMKRSLEVEVALARTEAELGMIPKEAPAAIANGAPKVKLERVKSIEKRTQHDLMALVEALAEQSGPSGEFVHFGATSYDIVDTALALQMRDALDLLDRRLRGLLKVLLDRAVRHRDLVCAARTHGQIGTPTTYGMRFALWADEVARHRRRLQEMRPRVLVGKLGGAVGTQASLGPKGLEVEARTMAHLGLAPAAIATQVISRDIHAEYLFWLAQVATTLDKVCTEVRTLARSELHEVEEPFAEGQVGSSTMPHKRNPVKSEQVCGLARIVRSFVEPGLLNNTLWDERDLTNSSAERVLLPEATILLDHMLVTTAWVLKGLRLFPEDIRRNLGVLGGLELSESVMMRLAPKIGRQRAHEAVRRAAMEVRASEGGTLLRRSRKAREKRRPFAEVLAKRLGGKVSRRELERALRPQNYLGTARERVDRVVAGLRKEFREG